jgi:ribosomal protein L27
MKSPILLFLLVLGSFFQSCKKGEVPDTNQKYIGNWRNTNNLDESYRIIIRQDGTAEYHEKSAFGFKDLTGYVFFDGYDFKIGTKNLGSKKFKTNSIPERVTITVTPYQYYLKATFNGIEYINELQ